MLADVLDERPLLLAERGAGQGAVDVEGDDPEILAGVELTPLARVVDCHISSLPASGRASCRCSSCTGAGDAFPGDARSRSCICFPWVYTSPVRGFDLGTHFRPGSRPPCLRSGAPSFTPGPAPT